MKRAFTVVGLLLVISCWRTSVPCRLLNLVGVAYLLKTTEKGDKPRRADNYKTLVARHRMLHDNARSSIQST